MELFIKKYQNWSDGHKMVAAYAYSDFCKMLKIEWTPPKYRWKETIPFEPTEKEVDALIAGTSKKVSITLQALQEMQHLVMLVLWNSVDANSETLRNLSNVRWKIRVARTK